MKNPAWLLVLAALVILSGWYFSLSDGVIRIGPKGSHQYMYTTSDAILNEDLRKRSKEHLEAEEVGTEKKVVQ